MTGIFKVRFIIFTISFVLSSCKTTPPEEVSELKEEPKICQEQVEITQYLRRNTKCLNTGLFKSQWESDKRQLYKWVPCNKVEYINQDKDIFGQGSDQLVALRNSTHYKIYHHLGREKPNISYEGPIGLKKLIRVLRGQEKPEYLESPIFEAELPKKIDQMIKGAKKHIFVDIFLLGGTWGIEIARQLVLAAERGVQVLIIHDTVSYFTVKNEMANLWEAIKVLSKERPNFYALDANIRPPLRPSSLPVGLDKLSPLIDKFAELPVASDGRSDHSKMIITDAMTPNDSSLIPRVLISSRNIVNSAGSYYHDEAVISSGPAASLAMLQYYPDIYWALDEAQSKKNRTDDELTRIRNTWLDPLWTYRQGPTYIAPQGLTSLMPLEVAAGSPPPELKNTNAKLSYNDVRNLDAAIMFMLRNAKKSVKIYGRIAYSQSMARALAHLIRNGRDVKIILDQQSPPVALMNSALPFMIVEEDIKISGIKVKEEDLKVKWVLPFRPTYTADDIAPLAQETHAKTIIIDGRYAMFGSVNMDSFTWLGGFREYSAWIDSPDIAQKAESTFMKLWDNPYLSVPHKVWLGKEKINPKTYEYYKDEFFLDQLNVDPSCDETCIDKEINKVIYGGQKYSDLAPTRRVIQEITMRNEVLTDIIQWYDTLEQCQ